MALQTMPFMTLREITEAVSGTYRGPDAALGESITGVAMDSRKVEEGNLFVPFVGARVDAHDLIPEVIASGALCSFSERELPDADFPYIIVGSSFQAMKDLAAYYRQALEIPVVGITGSVGKTSTKEMIAAILSEKFNVHKTEGNFNNEIGLPFTILKLRRSHDVAVLEMGINSFGEMTRLAAVARPDICVMTNIGDCHLEKLGDREGVYRAKSEMFTQMQDFAKPVVLNGDDPILRAVEEVHGVRPITYGLDPSNSIFATDISNRGINGTVCRLHIGDEEAEVHVPIPGVHAVYNMLAGATVAHMLGMFLPEIASGITQARTIPGHGHVIRSTNYTIFDDCYNANPNSMRSSLDMLDSTHQRKIAVLGDMLELGEKERELHYGVGQYAAEKDIAALFCVGDLSEEIYRGFLDARSSQEGNDGDTIVRHFPNKSELYAALEETLAEGDVVLVKASHAMGFTDIVNYLDTGALPETKE